MNKVGPLGMKHVEAVLREYTLPDPHKNDNSEILESVSIMIMKALRKYNDELENANK